MLSSEGSTTHVALVTDGAGRVTGWNEGCAALFGRAAADAIGRPLASLLADPHPSDLRVCMTDLPTTCDACDVHVLRNDGSTCAAELVFIRTLDRAGALAGGVAFFTTEPDDSDSAVVGRMPLRSVIDVLPGTFYVIRPDGSFALWNKTLEQVTLMSPEEVAQANALDMYDVPEKRIIAAKMRDVFEGDAKVFVEANYRDKHGRGTPYLLCGARITCHGRTYLCGMGLDISEQRAQEEQLRLRERALHAASNGLLITRCAGADNLIEYVNPAFERITGYSAAEVIGRDPRFMGVPDLDDTERAQVRQAVHLRREVNVVLRNRRKNGDIFWSDLTVTPVDDGKGNISHYIGVIADITAARERTATLEHEVNHDALTGLANRTLLWDRTEQAIHMAQRNKSLVATVLIDLNGFKQINDTFGHEAGDEVLTVVARRLQAAVRESDTVARLSGDEFVLVLVNQPSLRFTLRMIERLRVGMSKPVNINGAEMVVGASMGVSVYPHDGASAMELIRAADAAMYHAKAAKKTEVHFFSADMKSTTEAKQQLERDMRLALERDELFLLYQPKVCLRSGRIKGVEALLRWRHPEAGVMLPAAFLSDAEENGMIIPIGNFVLDEACAFLQRMQLRGTPPVPVAINVAYREFSRNHYIRHVSETMARRGIAGPSLEFELREAGLNANHHLGLQIMSQLRELGVQRAVDAFGDGWSDLRYLQQLPLTHLKIAKNAIQQIGPGNQGSALVKALVDVAHDLGVATIAKGVETRQQMDFLKASNCDELQGRYISEPLPESALLSLLATSAVDQ